MAIEFRRTPEDIAEMSGRVNERFVFGAARIHDPNYDLEKQALIQRYRDLKKSVPFREALEVVKRFQPFKPDSREPADPTSPTKQFPNSLRKFVAEELGLKGEKQKKVLFWTTVDSFVDKEFGADAVIEVQGENGREARLVRLDATLHEPGEVLKKDIGNRDRVIIYGEIPDPHENKKAYDERVRAVGKEVVDKLLLQAPARAERAA